MTDQQQRRTSAKAEMKRMFGDTEKPKLSNSEKIVTTLAEIHYRRETMLYKLFFDKAYRPERYHFIMEEHIKYKNKNQFRNQLLDNYTDVPVSACRYLTNLNVFASKTQSDKVQDEDSPTQSNPLSSLRKS